MARPDAVPGEDQSVSDPAAHEVIDLSLLIEPDRRSREVAQTMGAVCYLNANATKPTASFLLQAVDVTPGSGGRLFTLQSTMQR
jgi:hypothetical protein